MGKFRSSRTNQSVPLTKAAGKPASFTLRTPNVTYQKRWKPVFAMRYSCILIMGLLISCGQQNTGESRVNHWDKEDPSNQLRPELSKTQFDTLKSWDLGWFLLEPINIAKDVNDEVQLARRFSKGQKALYFFLFLDAEVTNGGFIQFYWNGRDMYLPPIIEGLKLIGDKELLDLVDKADKEFEINKKKFEDQREKDDWEPLYDNLNKFDEYDSIYYKIHDKTMTLIEKYAREHPNEFGVVK